MKKIAACVDTLCCVLPFEERYFKDRGVNGVYVGHPMFDAPAETPESDPARMEPPLPGMDGSGPRIAVFPGSRRAEISRQMPAMLEILSHGD